LNVFKEKNYSILRENVGNKRMKDAVPSVIKSSPSSCDEKRSKEKITWHQMLQMSPEQRDSYRQILKEKKRKIDQELRSLKAIEDVTNPSNE